MSADEDGETDLSKCDSLFEAEVLVALQKHGLRVIPQYPSCGYRIDLVAELDGRRLAIECDGEIFHLDEHGALKTEDVFRQEVLERAGWKVLRIPYRHWLRDSEAELKRVLDELAANVSEEASEEPSTSQAARTESHKGIELEDDFELGVVAALQAGLRDRTEVYKAALRSAGFSRIGTRISGQLDRAAKRLQSAGVIREEDGELFFADENSRTARYSKAATSTRTSWASGSRGYRRRAYPRRY
jgi:very-short-patch-repair endonuclease